MRPWPLVAGTLAIALSGPSPADDDDVAPVPPDTITVFGTSPEASRADSVSPRLVYGADYFAPFAPKSVGDMLRRVPGVAFNGNLGEPEAPRMRGLDSGYTQVLIDGQRIPTAGGGIDDESDGVFVDRIPAALVERIEVIRSPEASLDSQGIGGTLNIVLKSAGSYRGGQGSVGLTNTEDGTTRASGYLGYAGQLGAWSFMGGVTRQSRYNPKDKDTRTYAPEDEAPGAGLVLSETQHDRDVRDSRDTGLDLASTLHFSPGDSLGLSGYLLATAREEDELSREFDVNGTPETAELQHEQIDEHTRGLDLRYRHPLSRDGEWIATIGGSRTALDATLDAGDAALPDRPEDVERRSADDRDVRLSQRVQLPSNASHRIAFGVQLANRKRIAGQVRTEDETAFDTRYRVTERRADAYVEDRWAVSPALAVEPGARLEYTVRRQHATETGAATLDDADRRVDFNPDVHVRLQLTPDDQLRFSAARSVRRPDFDDLQPFVVRDGDLRVVGNPALDTEISRGLDLGLDHRLADTGIVGLNLFYRDVRHVIEDVRIGPRRVMPDNSGSGEVWGAEFDSQWPLPIAALSGMTLFANYTLLDSRIRDPLSRAPRRFQGQPTYVVNAGLTHELDPLPLSWGVTLVRQGASRDFGPLEIEEDRTQLDLQAFVQVRFGSGFTAQLSGSNLLDARRRESIRHYGRTSPQGEVEELEIEDELVGALLQLEIRGTF